MDLRRYTENKNKILKEERSIVGCNGSGKAI